MDNITHDELVRAGIKWLLKTIGARFALSELRASTTSGEIPDIIGFKSGYSVLIECKTSRSDFLIDKKKHFRQYPDMGMGNYRLFLCPAGLIKPEELPNGWGLLYYNSNEKYLKRIICWKGNIVCSTEQLKCFSADYRSEVSMLVSYIARRKL